MEKFLNKIIQGDVLDTLRQIPDEYVDCIITSPPYYGLRDYGVEGQIGLEPTLNQYLEKMLAITAELKRVLKKTGTMWWNHGDSYAGAGYGQKDTGKHGYSPESMARQKPVNYGDIPDKCLMMQAHRLAIRMIDEQGWILRNQIIWHKPNAMPSSVKDRFTVDFEPIFFFTKNKKYWFEPQYEPMDFKESDYRVEIRKNADSYKLKQPYKGNFPKSFSSLGRNKRSVWKISTKPYKEAHFATFPPGLIETPIKAGCPEMICKKCGNAREKIFNTEYDWQTKGKTRGEKQSSGNMATIPGHATKRVTQTGYTDCGCNAGWDKGIVLDPFMGSGTTAYVARQLGRNFVGIELNPDYIVLANKRLKQQVLSY